MASLVNTTVTSAAGSGVALAVTGGNDLVDNILLNLLNQSGSTVFNIRNNGALYGTAGTFSGQLQVTSGAVTAPSFSFTDDPNTGMSRPTTDALNFITNGSERVRINSSGSVGIGTNNPDYRLTVDAGTTNEIARFRSTDNDALISISDNTDAVYVGLDASADIMSLGFSNSFASTNLSIDTIGNVGIGTTSPSSNMHVSYSSGVTDITAGFLSGTAGPGMRGQNTSTTANTYFPIDFRCSDADARIAFQYSGTSNQGQLLFITENNSSSPSFGIYDRGNDATRVLVNDTTSTGVPNKTFEVKYANTSTNVTQQGLSGGGIGDGIMIHNTQETDNVYANLDFRARNADGRIAYQYKTATNVGDFHFITDNTGSPQSMMTIKNDGNVGIGDDTPENKLTVNGSSRFKDTMFFATTNRGLISWGSMGGGTGFGMQAASGNGLSLGANATWDHLVILTGGNVGIGTNAPEAALTVAHLNAHQAIFRTAQTTASERAGGGFSSSGNATAASRYARLFLDADGANFSGTDYFTIEKFGNSGEVKFLQYSNANMSFWVNTSTQAMTIKNDGNVGIGTTAPVAHLHVSKSAGTTTVLTQVAANSTVGYEIKKTGSTTQHWKIVDGQTVNGTLEFYDATDSATRMAINGSGSVGIGTAAPATPLHVYTNSASGQEIMLENDGAGEVGLILRTDRGSDGNLLGWLGFDGNDDGGTNTRYATIESFIVDNTNGTEDGSLRFSVMAGGNDVESMTIAAKSGSSDIGWVGIGTNAPTFPLQVEGPNLVNGSAKRIVCFRDTTSAAAGTGAGIALGGYTNGTASAINDFGVIQGIKENGTAGNYASALTFHTRANGANTAEQMRITSTGSVGIGCTPVRELDVDGRVRADTYGFRSDTTLRWYYFDDYSGSNFIGRGGNAYTSLYDGGALSMAWKGSSVGIGTTDPAALLHVDGTVRVGVDDAGHDVMLYGATTSRYWEWDASHDLVRQRDNVKTCFGNGDDLEIYHDGSNSHIKNSGSLYVASETSGDLYLRSDDDIFIQPQGGENGITLTGDGAVTLYHNSSSKLATTSYGTQTNGGMRITGNHTDTGSQLNIWCDASGHGRSAVYDWFFYTGGNDARSNLALFLNSSGCVGIGTDGPGTQLDVNQRAGDNTYPLKIRGNIDNNGGFTGITFGYEGDTRNWEKARIMVEGTSGDVQPNMHFLLNSGANNSSAVKADARLSILNDGNVGIGTSAPGSLLTIIGNSDNGDNASALAIHDQDSTVGSKLPAIMFYGGSTMQGRIRGGDGTFAIAVGSTPTTALSIDTSSQAVTLSNNLTLSSRITFSGGSNQYLEIGTNSIALKNSSGSVLWNSASSGGSGTVTSVATSTGLTGGTITTSGTLSVTGAVCMEIDAPSGSAAPTSNSFDFLQSGGITISASGNNVTFSSSSASDYRLKKNVTDFNSESWTKVKSVSCRKFDFDAEKFAQAMQDDYTIPRPASYGSRIGFIAHELQALGIDGAVEGEKDGVDENGVPIYQKVSYTTLVPVLWGALNEAIRKIEILESKVQALEDSS